MAISAAELRAFVTLAADQGFQAELAAVRAKATFKDLLGTAPDFNWRFSAERAVRNATALQLSLRHVAEHPDRLAEVAAAARVTAQAWEGLAILGERATRLGASVNAAVAYELAGYQANAACLARLGSNPRGWSAEPTFNGLASAFVQRLLIRVMTSSAEIDRPPEAVEAMDHDQLAQQMAEALGARGLVAAARFLLSGDATQLAQAGELLSLAGSGFQEIGDAQHANLTANLLALLPTIAQRSTWEVLRNRDPGSLRWDRYLRILARGLGAQVLDSRSISELWPSQIKAVEGGLLDSESSKVIRMPTSAGKTRVAEMAIVHTLVQHPEALCLYVAPYRALVAEVEGAFGTVFTDLGYPSSAMSGSYESDALDEAMVAEDRILVLTPEKLDLILRFGGDALDRVGIVVLDEGHIVGDASRGARYELLVTRLRRRLPGARFLFLSAVVPHQTLVEFAEWVNATANDVVESDWRPSIQRLARLDWSSSQGAGILRYDPSGEGEALARFLPNLIRQQRFEYRSPSRNRVRHEIFPESGSKGQIAAALAWELAPQGSVLIFCAQTDWAQSVGNAIGRRVELARLTGEAIPIAFQPSRPPRSHLVALEWLGPDDPTTRLLLIGVGVHHGRQPEAVRMAIEEDFRQRRLSVLAATTTLGQGVNLPVRTVIVHSVWRYDEDTDTRIRLPARDYWNIAGRAGRAGEETEGTIIHIVKDAMDGRDYNDYRAARDHLPPIDSALYRVLVDLVEGRLSEEAVASKLDAELLALLVEEAAGEVDDADLAVIIDQSLVGIQSRRDGRPTGPLVASLARGASRIRELVPDPARRAVYSATGLRTESCVLIAGHVESHLDRLATLLPRAGYGELTDLVELLLDGLGSIDEMQPRTAYAGSVTDLLLGWLEGRPVANDLAQSAGGEDISRFIEEFFAYLLPWGVTAYLRVASHLVGNDAMSAVVSGLPSLIKYGVPTVEAAWAMSAGVPDRQTAILLANVYASRDEVASPAAMRRWLGDLDPEELSEGYTIPESALVGLSRAIFRSTRSTGLAVLDMGRELLPMTVRLRGSRVANAVVGSLRGDVPLAVRRDYDSPYRNATYVEADGRRIGYLRPSDALVIGPEIDADARVSARFVSAEPGPAERPILTFELEAAGGA